MDYKGEGETWQPDHQLDGLGVLKLRTTFGWARARFGNQPTNWTDFGSCIRECLWVW